MKSFTVKKSAVPIALDAGWDSGIWKDAQIADVDYGFPDKNSDHTPLVQIKMLHDNEHICGLFRVEDRYVVARATENQHQVCRDSCVEFFVKPEGCEYYFNFEMNCGGTMLLWRCRNIHEKDYVVIPEEDLATVKRYHTLPRMITEEITEPVTWYLGFSIPVAFFRKWAAWDKELSGNTWTANFSKCADKCSHPTWLSWVHLSHLSFHLPDEFGQLIFE